MIRSLGAVLGLYLAAAWRVVWMWDLTEGTGRWRRHGKSHAPDPHWTHHRSGW
jgi:hypothetical protein